MKKSIYYFAGDITDHGTDRSAADGRHAFNLTTFEGRFVNLYRLAISRRSLFCVAASFAGFELNPATAKSQEAPPLLAAAPIDLGGDWGAMVPDAAHRVVEAMRKACLEGIILDREGQPDRLRVELHSLGPPAIWLHHRPRDVAWINVNIGPRDWSKLAYQFGHELGHVVANSWREGAEPAAPCQWLEEAMVEAFALRGLARLADHWSIEPPFPDDAGFGASIAVYRQHIVEAYGRMATSQGLTTSFAGWFKSQRHMIEAAAYLSEYAKAASIKFLEVYDRHPSSLTGLSALNRWPERSRLCLPDYLQTWEINCTKLGLSAIIPKILHMLL